MNLDNAIAAHAQWKTKFRAAITAGEALDAITIAKDDCCELGKWLHTDGRTRFGYKPEFTTLIEKHKAFHKEAGLVAATINSKKLDQASKMLEGGSSFGTASTAVGVAVNALKRAIG